MLALVKQMRQGHDWNLALVVYLVLGYNLYWLGMLSKCIEIWMCKDHTVIVTMLTALQNIGSNKLYGLYTSSYIE